MAFSYTAKLYLLPLFHELFDVFVSYKMRTYIHYYSFRRYSGMLLFWISSLLVVLKMFHCDIQLQNFGYLQTPVLESHKNLIIVKHISIHF